MVYFSTGGNVGKVAQDPASLRGKILRLGDDGSAPPDNPFAGRPGGASVTTRPVSPTRSMIRLHSHAVAGSVHVCPPHRTTSMLPI